MLQTAASDSPGSGQSVDDDEEGDSGVTREFEEYEVERFRQMGRHLDLMWNVGKKPQPAPCDCCEGTGARKCRYCNSTGAMMVGHERFCSLEQGCKPCPICNGTGEVKCSHCQGTGYRAGWLERGCPVEQ